ncbi:MAG: elongation factor P [Elusimicrobiota bacterium]
MAVDTSDFHNGLNIEVEGEPYTVVWFQHHKPGKGGGIMRTKMRNLRTGSTVERSFKSGERFRELSLEKRPKTYLYVENGMYYFMDQETYEQVPINKEMITNALNFIVENATLDVLYLDDKIIGVELPPKVRLKITSTAPGARGDTVANATKPATLETGYEIQVPLFIKEDEYVVIDTTTGEYVERG